MGSNLSWKCAFVLKDTTEFRDAILCDNYQQQQHQALANHLACYLIKSAQERGGGSTISFHGSAVTTALKL